MPAKTDEGTRLEDLIIHCAGCEYFCKNPEPSLPLKGHCSAPDNDDCPVFWHGCCTVCGSLEVFKLRQLADKELCLSCGKPRMFETVGVPNGSVAMAKRKTIFATQPMRGPSRVGASRT